MPFGSAELDLNAVSWPGELSRVRSGEKRTAMLSVKFLLPLNRARKPRTCPARPTGRFAFARLNLS
jgi:hypothetical protein